MTTATLPVNEELRLQDLYSYDLLDTGSESDFDDLVELASQICQCPISLISLLDKDRQWFKARSGWEVQSTPRDVAFCSHAILQDDVMVVEDSFTDERFIDNPLATGAMNIRFYAGAPIVSPTGHKLGTLCIIDHKPKTLTTEEERALQLLSNQVTKLLEIRRKNMLIRQRAEEMLVLKSRAMRQLMQETETDKKALAANLHEGFAQEIASSILYLKMAEEQEASRIGCIQKAKQQLHATLVGMRSLSAKIAPAGAEWLTPHELVSEFVIQAAVTYPFSIKVQEATTHKEVTAELSLAAIRIMEKWLSLLVYNQEITSVSITVIVDKHLALSIEDDGRNLSAEQRTRHVVESGIYDKVHAFSGVVDLLPAREGGNLFRFNLPLID
ncbi:MAG TPA: GAF domain-containing protein [Chitinophagaceae bacterium]|nr:GAF domain-containing protein [Chitinophagaceae bacterium]